MRSWLIALALLAMPPLTQAIEEPDHRIERQLGAVEIREYASYVVAEVVVASDAQQAGSEAFPILAGYIFGKNKSDKKFAMTAPVTQTAVPVKLEMTAPVTTAAVPGGQRVQFVLPRGVTLATAPEPIDPRVQLREVAGSRVAALRYSGFWSAANDAEHLAKLQSVLRDGGLSWSGEPVFARYNAPFVPWFLRRNEVWLVLP
jgi:hypothetical protein